LAFKTFLPLWISCDLSWNKVEGEVCIEWANCSRPQELIPVSVATRSICAGIWSQPHSSHKLLWITKKIYTCGLHIYSVIVQVRSFWIELLLVTDVLRIWVKVIFSQLHCIFKKLYLTCVGFVDFTSTDKFVSFQCWMTWNLFVSSLKKSFLALSGDLEKCVKNVLQTFQKMVTNLW